MEVQQDPGRGKAAASLVCGILGLVFTIFSYTLWLGIAAIILSIVGLILGVSARKSMPAGTAGMATAGLVCSIVALAISSIVVLSCAICASAVGCALAEINRSFPGGLPLS